MKIQGRMAAVFGVLTLCFLGNLVGIQIWIHGSRSYGRVINLAGKQRMLMQKLTKDVLFITEGLDVRKDAEETAGLFDRTLQGLMKGDPTLGLPPAENRNILKQLQRVEGLWKGFDADLVKRMSGGRADLESSRRLFDSSVKILREMNLAVKMMEGESARSIVHLRNLVLFLFALSCITVAVSFYYVKRGIINRIRSVTRMVGRLAEGDLQEVCVEDDGTDEISELNQSIAALTRVWNTITREFLDVTSSISLSTSRVWSSFNVNIKGIGRQNVQAEQIATASEEMSQTSTEIAGNVSLAADHSSKATGAAEEGSRTMEEAAKSIEELTRAADGLGTMIGRLDGRIGEIGQIIHLINEIADQTNLLALNAAIEAARAGEYGRGFAVVADEVRKLAEKTIKATSSISETIHGIQSDSRETDTQMQVSRQKVSESVHYIEETRKALANILAFSRNSSDEITRIATAAEEQSTTSEEITRSIADSAEVSKKMLETAQGMVAEVDTLNQEIDKLAEHVSWFRLPEDAVLEIQSAMVAHGKWVQRLYRMYYAGERIDPSEVDDPRECRFGKWYYGKGVGECGSLKEFSSLDTPHRELHQHAKAAVEARMRGESDRTLQEIERVEELSREMVSSLQTLAQAVKGGSRDAALTPILGERDTSIAKVS